MSHHSPTLALLLSDIAFAASAQPMDPVVHGPAAAAMAAGARALLAKGWFGSQPPSVDRL